MTQNNLGDCYRNTEGVEEGYAKDCSPQGQSRKGGPTTETQGPRLGALGPHSGENLSHNASYREEDKKDLQSYDHQISLQID